jgi:hypothetical protein
MPEVAGKERAEQLTFLTGPADQERTQKRLRELLNERAGSNLTIAAGIPRPK